MADDNQTNQNAANDGERQDQQRDQNLDNQQNQQNRQQDDANRDQPADETSGAGYGNHAGDQDGTEMNQGGAGGSGDADH